MPDIHPTSIVDTQAQIAENVHIGPYCTVGPDVRIDSNCKLISHIVIDGETHIGESNTFYPFSSIGLPPQDLKYDNEKTRLVIGNHNTIREYVTINTGTAQDEGITQVGSHNLFMVQAHVAHDCRIGDHVILANGATLAGHVHIDDYAIIGGLSAIHQYVRIGRHAIIGGKSGVEKDVIPFGAVSGNRARLDGLNLVGLRRRKFDKIVIQQLQNGFNKILVENGDNLQQRATDNAKELESSIEGKEFLHFITQKSHRGLCLPEESTHGK